jgi:hypothetical protein
VEAVEPVRLQETPQSLLHVQLVQVFPSNLFWLSFMLTCNSHSFGTWVIQVSTWVLFAVVAFQSVAAQDFDTHDGLVRPGDSVWEVSTRHLTSTCPQSCEVDFQVSQLDTCSWSSATKDSLIEEALQDPVHTIIYVHGNWMPLCDARQRAILVYKKLACRSDVPIRMIAFSWPSEQKDRVARDVISKKPLITANSFYLADFINQLPEGQPASVVGYSFGAAVVCGSLHLLSGGALDRQLLYSNTKALTLMRVSLIAPAFDRTDLSPNGRYSQTLDSVDRMVNLYNSQDPILRRFRFFDRSTEPVAAGFSGLAVTRALSPLESHAKVEQFDCCAVGRSHSEVDYYSCIAIYNSIDNLLGK